MSAHPSAYAGTDIEAGYGVAVVLSTGGGTYMGQVAQLAMATAEPTYKGFPKRAAAKAMQEVATKARACVKHKETVVAASRCGAVMVDLPPERVLGSDKVGGAVTALASMVADGRTMYFLVAAPGAKDFTLQIATKVCGEVCALTLLVLTPLYCITFRWLPLLVLVTSPKLRHLLTTIPPCSMPPCPVPSPRWLSCTHHMALQLPACATFRRAQQTKKSKM